MSTTADRDAPAPGAAAAAGIVEPLLAVEDLVVYYRGRVRTAPVRAVDGVSLAVGRRRTLGLIGESGSGKTTIGRAVMGLVRPTSGEIRFDGLTLNGLSKKRLKKVRPRFQMVFQDATSSLDPRKTIRTSLYEPLLVQHALTREAAERVDDLMARVGLNPGLGERYPHELSGGQKQRVNIARSLVLAPDLLVCDEPVSALDVSVQADVLNLLARLKQEWGLASLFIGHDLAVVAHVADQIGVLYLGKLMELGPTGAVMDNPLHPYTVALRSAEPEVVVPTQRSRQRIVLAGEIPSPAHPPSGCVFHTRCPYAEEVCTKVVPAWREVRTDRWVACHLVPEEPAPSAPAPPPAAQV